MPIVGRAGPSYLPPGSPHVCFGWEIGARKPAHDHQRFCSVLPRRRAARARRWRTPGPLDGSTRRRPPAAHSCMQPRPCTSAWGLWSVALAKRQVPGQDAIDNDIGCPLLYLRRLKVGSGGGLRTCSSKTAPLPPRPCRFSLRGSARCCRGGVQRARGGGVRRAPSMGALGVAPRPRTLACSRGPARAHGDSGQLLSQKGRFQAKTRLIIIIIILTANALGEAAFREPRAEKAPRAENKDIQIPDASRLGDSIGKCPWRSRLQPGNDQHGDEIALNGLQT